MAAFIFNKVIVSSRATGFWASIDAGAHVGMKAGSQSGTP